MSSPNVPAGRETSQASQPITIPMSIPQSNPSSTVSTSSAISTAFFLSLFALLAALVCIYWIRRRRIISKVSDERPSEKEVIHDVEALAVSCPIVPVTPVVDVRWAPQIRSISGPRPDQDTDRKSATLFPKRARSPPPSNFNKTHSLFPDLSYPRSAPVHVLSFPQHEMQHSAKFQKGELSPPVTPLAVAVSGTETRFLGRPGLGSKN